MSQTVASALNNRVVSFVNPVDKDFNCVICKLVADEPVRCNAMCDAIFCNGCMKKALHDQKKKTCPNPECNQLRTKVNPTDVRAKKQILKHDVYCLNKGNDQSDNIDQHTCTDSRKRKAAPDDEKCTWIGKYDQLAAHLNQCDYELVKCNNKGCAKELMRRELQAHLPVCAFRRESCKTCDLKVLWSAMTEHQEKECPKALVTCEVIGCNKVMMRRDYKNHQNEAAKQHVHLLSAALIEAKQKNSIQIECRITDIAAKLREAAVDEKRYFCPRFDVFFRGSHKLYISADIEGDRLELYLYKDVELSDDKSRLDVGGTSFTVTKAGLPDKKYTLDPGDFLEPPLWSWGFGPFLEDMTPYIDNDIINVTIDIKLNKENESIVL